MKSLRGSRIFERVHISFPLASNQGPIPFPYPHCKITLGSLLDEIVYECDRVSAKGWVKSCQPKWTRRYNNNNLLSSSPLSNPIPIPICPEGLVTTAIHHHHYQWVQSTKMTIRLGVDDDHTGNTYYVLFIIMAVASFIIHSSINYSWYCIEYIDISHAVLTNTVFFQYKSVGISNSLASSLADPLPCPKLDKHLPH